MRKFLFSGTVISALFGVGTVIKTTKNGPRDWRLILIWVSWGCTLAVALGTVVKQSQTGNEIKE